MSEHKHTWRNLAAVSIVALLAACAQTAPPRHDGVQPAARAARSGCDMVSR